MLGKGPGFVLVDYTGPVFRNRFTKSSSLRRNAKIGQYYSMGALMIARIFNRNQG